MVCTDQSSGERGGPEPLLTLAAFRRRRGRIHFGVLLSHEAEPECGTTAVNALPRASGVSAAKQHVVILSVDMPVSGC